MSQEIDLHFNIRLTIYSPVELVIPLTNSPIFNANAPSEEYPAGLIPEPPQSNSQLPNTTAHDVALRAAAEQPLAKAKLTDQTSGR